MSIKSPLARVKDEFGGKDKLVDKIVGLLGSDDEPKDEMRRRLLGAANSKLMRLHRVATQVKEIGGRDKLASAAAAELGHAKDKDYVTKLGSYSSGRLVDMLESARRRTKRQAARPGAAQRKKSAALSARTAKAAADAATGTTKSSRRAAAKAAAAAKAPAKRSGKSV